MTLEELRAFEKEQLGNYILGCHLGDMRPEQIEDWLNDEVAQDEVVHWETPGADRLA